MKALVSIVSVFSASGAQAHEALAPHSHPHGFSLLPELDSLVLAVIVLVVGALAIAQIGRG